MEGWKVGILEEAAPTNHPFFHHSIIPHLTWLPVSDTQ